jgi:phosphonate transport system substrate-binding protein
MKKIAYTLLLLFSATLLQAEECPHHGELGRAYCDRDRDMLADSPTDPSQWIDPYELVFAYSPVEDPNVYKQAWGDFIRHLSRVTGKKVVFFPFQSNDAEIEAMRIGKLHVAGFNTGSNPKAVNCAGFHPIMMMGKADGSYGYEMEIITYPASGINSIQDISGQTVVFTAPSSNSGYKAPVALLKEKFGLDKDKDYRYIFSGKHSNSLLSVAKHIYPIATIANSVRKRIEKRKRIQKNQIKILYTSQTFPTTGFGYAHNLKPSLVEKIRHAFETFPWIDQNGNPSSLLKEFSSSGYNKFIPLDYKKDFEIIRLINKENAITNQCR